MLDPRVVDANGNSALHFVASTNLVEVANWLLDIGFDLTAVNVYNQTPLDVARESGTRQMTRLLEKRYAMLTQYYCSRVDKREALAWGMLEVRSNTF